MNNEHRDDLWMEIVIALLAVGLLLAGFVVQGSLIGAQGGSLIEIVKGLFR